MSQHRAKKEKLLQGNDPECDRNAMGGASRVCGDITAVYPTTLLSHHSQTQGLGEKLPQGTDCKCDRGLEGGASYDSDDVTVLSATHTQAPPTTGPLINRCRTRGTEKKVFISYLASPTPFTDASTLGPVPSCSEAEGELRQRDASERWDPSELTGQSVSRASISRWGRGSVRVGDLHIQMRLGVESEVKAMTS